MEVLSAENGGDANQILRNTPGIAIVLMDIMMPKMDGYETIRQIRKAPAFARLPIITLTAKAMKGDREQCIEAGASDYISTPVDINQLLSLIRVWLYKWQACCENADMNDSNDLQIPVGVPTGIPPGPATTGIIDWEGLRKRYKSNPAFVERIAAATLKATREAPAQLRQWAAEGNLTEIGEAAHTLKGATGNLMAGEVAGLAERVQVAARGGGAESVGLALALADALDGFVAALSAGAPPAET